MDFSVDLGLKAAAGHCGGTAKVTGRRADPTTQGHRARMLGARHVEAVQPVEAELTTIGDLFEPNKPT